MGTALAAIRTLRDDSMEKRFTMTQIALTLVICTTILALLLTGCSPLSTSQPPAPTPEPATPTPDPSRLVVKREAITRVDELLTQMTKDGTFSGSVLIAQDGKVLLSKGYGLADRAQEIPNTPQTRFRLGSITKQFTATAIIILQSQGKLNVQDPICSYIADCPTAWRDITIHHLLTHTSGLSSEQSDQLYQLIQTAASDSATSPDPAHFLGLAKELPLDTRPGEQYAYSNIGYILMAHIIEQVSGQSFAAFLEQAIFSPLKMVDTGYQDNSSGVARVYTDRYVTVAGRFSSPGISDGAGGLYSTSEDLFLWDQALYTDHLLPWTELQQMFEPYVPETDLGPDFGYGYGWGVWEDQGRPVVFHTGGGSAFATFIIRYPEDGLAEILLTNQGPFDGSIWVAISNALFGEEDQ
jgi:CubicO group peptidase (beta-lactamase class C family)